jgi:Domain of unknown function (DUF4265)
VTVPSEFVLHEQPVWRVFRVWFGDSFAPRDEISDKIEVLGSLVEWSSRNLLAVDAANVEHAQRVANFLTEREDAGQLFYETGRLAISKPDAQSVSRQQGLPSCRGRLDRHARSPHRDGHAALDGAARRVSRAVRSLPEAVAQVGVDQPVEPLAVMPQSGGVRQLVEQQCPAHGGALATVGGEVEAHQRLGLCGPQRGPHHQLRWVGLDDARPLLVEEQLQPLSGGVPVGVQQGLGHYVGRCGLGTPAGSCLDHPSQGRAW